MNLLKNILLTLASLIKVVLKSKLLPYPKTTPDKSLIIMGNGPSACTIISDKYKYENNDFMCVNLFAAQNEFQILKPKYYLLLDDRFFNIEIDQINNPEESQLVKNNPELLEIQSLINKSWRNIMNADWEIQLFLPQIFKSKPIVKHLVSKKLKITFFNYTVVNGFEVFENLMFKLGLGSPQCQNVINTCVFQAINYGFQEIKIVGIESNLHQNLMIDNNNNLMMRDDHFYRVENEWIPVRDNSGNPVFLGDVFISLSKMLKSHKRIAKYAQFRNVRVYNITPNSFVDAYDKKTI